MSAFPLLVATLVLLAPAAARSQAIYRCADAGGQVTYQQEPCKSGSKGTTVEILPDNGLARDSATLEAEWTAAAKQGVITLGMPRRYVRDALGAPTEMRQGLPTERATEIWTYRRGDAARRVGFLDGRVTWDRAGDGNTLDPPAPRVVQASPAQPPPPIRMAPSPVAPAQPTLPPPAAAIPQAPIAVPQPAPAPPQAVVPQPVSAPASRTAATPTPMSPPPLPPGVTQDASGMIVMRRPDALPLDGSGAGQPTVRVLPLPSQVAPTPPATAASPAMPPLSSTASTWAPSVPAQGAMPPPVPAATAPRTEAMMVARRSIRPGTACSAVLAQAGEPDRTDTIRVPAPGGGGDVPAARHTYASDGSDPPRDVAFTCVGGIVREVERGVR